MKRSACWRSAVLLGAALSVSAQRAGAPPAGQSVLPTGARNLVVVDDDFTSDTPGWGVSRFATVQDGVNAVRAGGTVRVHAGQYLESVSIHKELHLRGVDRATVVIVEDTPFASHGMHVTADGVRISGVTVGCVPFVSIPPQGGPALHLDGVVGCVVTDCEFSASMVGMLVAGGGGNEITNNHLRSNLGYGLQLVGSVGNTITGNLVTAYETSFGFENGVLIQAASDDNHLEANTVGGFFSNLYGGGRAVEIQASAGNSLMANVIAGSVEGLTLSQADATTVWHNAFRQNYVQAQDDGATNVWDDGYPSGGNLWDDYPGEDVNGDLIGDTPYPIGGGGTGVDRYPLMGEREEGMWVYVSWQFDPSTPGWGVDHFDSIQDGVAAVPEGGTVLVLEGSYHESVLIDRPLRLIGTGSDSTTVDGSYVDIPLQVVADGVELRAIGVEHSILGGIVVQDATDCAISRCALKSSFPGIDAARAPGLQITDTEFSQCDWGVVVVDSPDVVLTGVVGTGTAGIRLSGCSEAVLSGNTLSCAGWCNIQLDGCTASVVADNSLSDGTVGIELLSAVGNTITRNELDGHYVGVSADAGTMGNLLYANRFTNGTGPHRATDLGANAWDNGLPAGGNHWDDYTGFDTDGDGFGEQPYVIEPGINYDFHPATTAAAPLPAEVWVDGSFDPSTPGWGYDRFAIIQHGVDGVAEQGTVHVADGVYAETVVVSKPLLLEGASMAGTILDGNGATKIVNVVVEGVTLRRLWIRDGSSGWGAGIYLSANHTHIQQCHVQQCNDGVWMNNKHHTTVQDCELVNNDSGIDMIYSSYGLFTGNDFLNNRYGLEMRSSSSNNLAHGNNFIGNSSWNALDEGANAWYEGFQGNHWDDYTGPDADGNGIGDAPYFTRGGGRDEFPRILPF